MNKVDLLDSLYDVRDQITRLIIYSTPTNDAETQKLRALVQKREQLSAFIASVIQADLRATAAQVSDACVQLDAFTAKLRDLANTVEGVTTALGIVSDVIGMVMTLVSLAAA